MNTSQSRTLVIVLVFSFIVALLFNLPAAAQTNAQVAKEVGPAKPDSPNWPQFRGRNCSGIAAEKANPPVEFGLEKNIKWKIALPPGHSSPSIWGDNIFVTGFDQDKKTFHTICIDRNNGTERWRKSIQPDSVEKVHAISNPANATPATDGRRVYSYFGSYGLACYDFAGNTLWTLELPVPSSSSFGVGTSPIIVKDLVILNRDDFKNPKLLAIDRVTGKIIWEQDQVPKSRATGWSTPVVWHNNLILHRQDEVVGYSTIDGKRQWSVAIESSGASTPVIGDNLLYVGAWMNFGETELMVEVPDFESLLGKYDTNRDSNISNAEFPDDLLIARRPELGESRIGDFPAKLFFTMLDGSKDGKLDAGEWQNARDLFKSFTKDHGLTAIKPGGKGDITATHVKWQVSKNIPEVPSPVFYKGKVYMVKNGGIATCVDAQTGEVVYRKRIGSRGSYYSSPIIAHNRVYIASNTGIVTVFQTGDKFKILASNSLGEKIYATPAVVGNDIYVRTTEHLFAFGE